MLRGSPMTRAHITTLLERGVRQAYVDEYDLAGNQYGMIFNEQGSDKATETDVIWGGVSQYELQAENDTFNYDNGQEAWTKTYVHLEYTKGVQISRIAMEDELYGVLRKFSNFGGNLGAAGAYTKEVLAMTVFNNLSATVYTAEGTAYTLLSTTQFRVDGGVWANTPTSPLDLSYEAVETALALWRVNMVDQRGLKIMVQPAVLLVGPSDEFLAKRIVLSQLRPGGNDNDLNVVRTERDLKVMVSDFLTDDGRWFLLAPKAKTGLNFFNRRPTRVDRFDTDETGAMNMVGNFRVSSGASHVSGIWGTTG
jgi:hypothetical protein